MKHDDFALDMIAEIKEMGISGIYDAISYFEREYRTGSDDPQTWHNQVVGQFE